MHANSAAGTRSDSTFSRPTSATPNAAARTRRRDQAAHARTPRHLPASRPRRSCTKHGAKVHFGVTDRGRLPDRARHPAGRRRHRSSSPRAWSPRRSTSTTFLGATRHRGGRNRSRRIHRPARQRPSQPHRQADHPQEPPRNRATPSSAKASATTTTIPRPSPAAPAHFLRQKYLEADAGITGANFVSRRPAAWSSSPTRATRASASPLPRCTSRSSASKSSCRRDRDLGAVAQPARRAPPPASNSPSTPSSSPAPRPRPARRARGNARHLHGQRPQSRRSPPSAAKSCAASAAAPA